MRGMFGTGIELMFTGMGIVFVFLAMLVVAVTLMSWIVSRFFPDNPTPKAAMPGKPAPQAGNDEIIAAIGAALHRYRKDHPS